MSCLCSKIFFQSLMLQVCFGSVVDSAPALGRSRRSSLAAPQLNNRWNESFWMKFWRSEEDMSARIAVLTIWVSASKEFYEKGLRSYGNRFLEKLMNNLATNWSIETISLTVRTPLSDHKATNSNMMSKEKERRVQKICQKCQKSFQTACIEFTWITVKVIYNQTQIIIDGVTNRTISDKHKEQNSF